MGADLVGWMAKGPAKLQVPAARRAQIAEGLLAVLDWARSTLPADPQEAEEFLAGCEQEQLPPSIDSWWATSSPEEVLQLLARLSPERDVPRRRQRAHLNRYLRELLRAWPPEGCRDAAVLTDPDDPTQVLVFAGEMTWGDEPQGEAFLLLKQLAHSGIGEAVGIRLLAGFVTLDVPANV
mgnify:CR=1 FL=1